LIIRGADKNKRVGQSQKVFCISQRSNITSKEVSTVAFNLLKLKEAPTSCD
jgi:hypothetical protein